MNVTNTRRVALDVRTIQDHFPGIARYTYNLALALACEAPEWSWLLLYDAAQRNTLYDLDRLRTQPNIELIDCRAPNFSLVEQWRLPALMRQRKTALYHSPYYIMPYRAPCPSVVTIHDLIPLLYPRYFTPIQRVAFGLTVRLALRASKQIVADSQATASDLERLLGVQRERLSIAYAAADPAMLPALPGAVAALRERLALPDIFALYVGSNKPHKNLRLLVEACAATAPDERFHLVVGGQWDSRLNDPKILADELGVGQHIQWLGRSRNLTCPPCTPPQQSSLFRPSTKASACRFWRRWLVARRSYPPTLVHCQKSPATLHCCCHPATPLPGRRRSAVC